MSARPFYTTDAGSRASLFSVSSLLAMVAYLLLPAAAQAQFFYTTNSDLVTITITGYTGPGGDVTVPDSINGLPVTAIQDSAFYNDSTVTNLTIPDSITNIGNNAFAWCVNLANIRLPNPLTSLGSSAFYYCTSLTNVTVGDAVTSIGDYTFYNCWKLANATIGSSVRSIGYAAFYSAFSLKSISIPNTVTNIADYAFYNCTNLTTVSFGNSVSRIGYGAFSGCSLTNVTIPGSVVSIGQYAFFLCPGLRGVFFRGNAPASGAIVFDSGGNVTVYYLPLTTGWSSPFAGLVPVLWNPRMQTGDGYFGVRTNRFGFNITGTANIPIVIEASTSLGNAGWTPLQSSSLTNGSIYFSDPNWTNSPSRFYRVRSP
jgi:hypothetical protein